MLSLKFKEGKNVITLYGIKNCDTIKKARKWLTDNSVEYNFHDVRTDGIDAATLDGWIDQVGLETILNRRGTTWRKLDSDDQNGVNRSNVTALLLKYPAIIKRPVLDLDGTITVGFKAEQYQTIFN
jgi:arsenate reductase|tara:strand:- start:191 stop:568 length:378 start_codon:yes stop_codon:yes gene_type:complete